MDDLQSSEEAAFVQDDVYNILRESVEMVVQVGTSYQHVRVGQWTNDIIEHAMKRLTALGKPFKYIVTCMIMQRNGAGLHTASSCYWENASDGSSTYRFENKTMYCIVTAFGLSI